MKIDPELMHSAAGQASEVLKSLANPHRLVILCQLIGGERSVGELAGFLDLRSSTVSQHLSLLRRDGLVSARRDGQTIWYAIASEVVQKILETLFLIYCVPEDAGAQPNNLICVGDVPTQPRSSSKLKG
ncbi:MAG: metalloregulator ArsR/SmtB family transcription factor [Acidocella sp.]|nr:metalloregulator ArsR/SmtB family transcription factor [Acidocella sp.]MDE8350113.1 metalloregulator ArsR/SmtB family transcription factor [Acidocella sp.]